MTKSIAAVLSGAIGADRVSSAAEDLNARRFDQWALSHLKDWSGQAMAAPACVVRPRSTAEVQAIMVAASKAGAPVMPFGLGSGVCGGILPTPETVLLDLSGFNAVRSIDETNLLASFDAGKNGLEAEDAVAERGLTIGHWPQSVAISSVGGWVSTRASGQFSTAYGNIEDIIYSIEAVLPDGTLVNLGKAPRAAAGPDLRHLLMGAEGTMGVITGVTLALRRKPERQAFSAYYAKDMEAGFEAQRRIIQADWRPPVARQYDAREVRRMFRDHERDDQCLILFVHEGPAKRVELELAEVEAIAREAGLTPADPAATAGWMQRRNHVPSWRELFERGYVADTIEVSAGWSAIGKVYADVVAALSAVPNVINASAHSSHAYRTGLNLYFSFAAAHADPAERERAYLECWRRAMEATARHGGGIAHHHGAGRLRKPYLEYDLGPGGVSLLRRIKQAIDPQGIMNPGNLIPDA
ncbi:FAD-binding oxidoreductase [Phenylobacterium montanum]|uniref:FAD-binding oxidoreductase n=1 Tax=Phenylobacterium montanum TaxID=2823693 RepID=A0A975G1A0_9CAUL|nr:FAD-binding oxidoreductase [Caulobacter sp. S6]QUD88717.1 FAD-binding oxidoreductase [Caulobacter sp. S6]